LTHDAHLHPKSFLIGCFTTTQLARQFQQKRAQVVCSNKEAQKRLTEQGVLLFFCTDRHEGVSWSGVAANGETFPCNIFFVPTSPFLVLVSVNFGGKLFFAGNSKVQRGVVDEKQHRKMLYQFYLGSQLWDRFPLSKVQGVMCDNVPETTKKRKGKKYHSICASPWFSKHVHVFPKMLRIPALDHTTASGLGSILFPPLLLCSLPRIFEVKTTNIERYGIPRLQIFAGNFCIFEPILHQKSRMLQFPNV